MNIVNKYVLITIAAAMTSSYCKAVESWDCDGLNQENCHPFTDSTANDPSTGDLIYTTEGPGGADVYKCTSSIENQGNCNSGLIQCNYATSTTDLTTGQVLASGTVPGGATTDSCDS